MQPAKKIKLYDDLEVEVNNTLLDDFDYLSDFSKAMQENDVATLVAMSFAIVGGQPTYDKVKARIVEDKGYFSNDELQRVVRKILDLFPKASNRAAKRSWEKTSR